MNIFVTDADPNKSASCLPDKHIVKMPLETCQMLSIVGSAKWGHDFGQLPKLDGTPYKTDKGAFRNHPCTIWAQSHWTWLINHGLGLCFEYTHRYGKIHSTDSLLRDLLMSPPTKIKEGGLTTMPQAMPDHCKKPDSIDAYRTYYIQEKKRFAKWTKRDVPEWFQAA